jgi:hypothetical protein
VPEDTLAERTARQARAAVAGGFLQGAGLRLTRDPAGLWLHLPGESSPALITSVRPAFPLSMGPAMLVFYGRRAHEAGGEDAEGKPGGAPGEELGILRSLAELPREAQEMIAEEVERSYFVPRITRILSVDEQFGIQRWQVVTDRGPRTFEVTERSGIRPFDNFRMVIKDVDGNRYQIADLRLLDRRSQQWLDLQV